MKDIWGLLGKIAIIVSILAGVLALTKWGRNVYKKMWYSIIRYRPKIPRETMRIVAQYHSCWWHLGTINGKPAMQLHGILNIVNISDFNISICEVSIKKPKIVGYVMTRHSREDIYGDYPIPPYFKTKATVDFWIQPPICKDGEQLIVDLIFVDQFTNHHRINKIIFKPEAKRKKKKHESKSFPTESVNEISNPIERKVVSVLQAEIVRRKNSSFKTGGLGSIQTIYHGKKYCGFGPDWREVDSPELQAIVPDPKNAKIQSGNALILIRYYSTLKQLEKNEFIDNLLKRLSRDTAYLHVGYFILFILYRIGYLNKALETAEKVLKGDSAYGFYNFLVVLDGLLRYKYTNFSEKDLDDVEYFLKEIKEHELVPRIYERLLAARSVLILKNEKKD